MYVCGGGGGGRGSIVVTGGVPTRGYSVYTYGRSGVDVCLWIGGRFCMWFVGVWVWVDVSVLILLLVTCCVRVVQGPRTSCYTIIPAPYEAL